ncbi:hypothetical protein Tco_0713857 [Tanacetum coccineum]
MCIHTHKPISDRRTTDGTCLLEIKPVTNTTSMELMVTWKLFTVGVAFDNEFFHADRACCCWWSAAKRGGDGYGHDMSKLESIKRAPIEIMMKRYYADDIDSGEGDEFNDEEYVEHDE